MNLTSNAFLAWDRPLEALEITEARIHDGAKDPRALRERGHWYINTLNHLFPYSQPQANARILEIGSGLGYIMEAAAEQFVTNSITGLDVAPSMIQKASDRLTRDLGAGHGFNFAVYDGVKVPFPDETFDYIYSVATLQHIPKPFVYNLFYELLRLLKPTGWCNLHFLSANNILAHSAAVGWHKEVAIQVNAEDNHWHHFYSYNELITVLGDGVGVHQLNVVDGEVSIWVSFSPTGPTLRDPDLLLTTHLGASNHNFVRERQRAYAERERMQVLNNPKQDRILTDQPPRVRGVVDPKDR
jgi:ubiquinone/menaquinone biosynthesis C-methylase UbiE